MSLLHEIVEKCDGIYRAKYKRDREQRYFGQYIAIDVETGDGFIAASAAAAIRSGQSAGKLDALGRFQNQLQERRESDTALRGTARAHFLTVNASSK